MGKKFNFNQTPAASEIGEEMTLVNNPDNKIDGSPMGRKHSIRTKNEDWTLVQCRLPNDLNKRMNIYNAKNDVSKNDFLVCAVRTLLDKLGV